MFWMIVWAGLLGLIALVWTTRHVEISRARRQQIPLSSRSYDGPPPDAPFVSVLIAGKDEEANIERAVRSMLRQDYPNFEVIVVNDRSTDRTPRILESLKAEDQTGRLRVLHLTELREGWFGKNNAMREGVALARGEWLCFGDADCEQTSERSLSTAVRHAVETGAQFVSVLPRLATESLWEQIIQPVAGAVMVFWFDPRRVNDPNDPAAYANGAFMLMTRRCYEAIGGHERVRTEVNEDMHMARLAKERGQKLVVAQNDDLYTVRMYSSFGQIWRGWSRIFYGCFGTFRRLRITLMMLLCTNVFPYGSLLIAAGVFALTNWQVGNAGWYVVGATAVLAVSMQLSVIARFYRMSYANPWLAPTFIVGAVICIGMLISAILKLKGRATVTWRGTTYRGEAVVTPPPPAPLPERTPGS